MSLPTKYTGLILASGELVKDPTSTILETLAPFKISILESSLLTVRDRFVLSILIELNPDHREAIAEDLDLLTNSGKIDVAYDFKPLAWPIPVEESLEIKVVSAEFSSEALYEINQALKSFGRIRNYSINSLGDLALLEISIEAGLDLLEKLKSSLGSISDRFHISFSVLNPDSMVIGRDSVLLDMDSTFINEEVIDIIAEIAGVGAEVSKITERAMRGELDFSQALKDRVSLLKGKPSTILEVAKSRITLTVGARELIDAVMKRNGSVGVVSGGFHDVIDSVLEPLNLDLVKANRFEIVNGLFTGNVLGEIIDRDAKERVRRDFAQGFSRSITIGDGANDIAMIHGADIGVAFMAKEILRDTADLVIRTRDLRAVLPLIGY